MSHRRLDRLIESVFPFRGLPRPVYILFVARIINRMGDFVRFFLTLYLTRVLELDAAQTGLIVTLAALAGMPGGLLSGRLADRIGRKRVMLGAQLFSAFILLGCGFSPDASWLPWALIASQFFFGAIRPVSQALVTDLTPVTDRRKAFSLLYFGINIGIALGPIIAGFLFENHRPWIFWGDAATTLIGVVLVAAMVPEPPSHEIQRGDDREDVDESGAMKSLLSRPILLGYLALMLLSHFVYAQTHFALPLLLDGLFGARSAKNFGLLMSVNALTVLIFTPLLMNLWAAKRPAWSMVWGGAFYAVGFGCLAFIPGNMSWILISTVIWTWGEIIFATNARVFSAAYTPLNHRGRFASIEHVVSGAGAVLSPVVAGLFTAILGARGIWYPILLLSLVLTGGMIVLDRKDHTTLRQRFKPAESGGGQ